MAVTEKDINVSKESAELFYDQCLGSHNGQMASVPNNPVLNSICRCHRVDNKCEFAKFLREVADHLEDERF